MLGAAIAFAMLWSGLWVTAFGINMQSALGFPLEARAQALNSVMKIFFFFGCVALAVAKVRTPNVHKRLMVLAMLPLVWTSIPRILYALFAPTGSPQRPGLGEPAPALVGVPGALITDLLLVAVIFYDRRATGRIHLVYMIGLIVLLAMQILRMPVGSTAIWQSAASWLATFSS